ncbi:hypothetical protein DPMN_035341 [Dreissena polymorpha]|uniref:Uncharacterized protein n=1 Tax=Dreissena polymorpha TaxID=45954 RepID=A0A9D4MAS2_DREPO|nr:hypothetical protein DPMN_035341 [Dreissena polymorpha]
MGHMLYAANVAPVQPAHPRSLVRVCILMSILKRYIETLRVFIEETVAPNQTAQVRRLGLSYTGRICHKTNVFMPRV